MNTALNATFWEYITDKANLPLLIVLAAIIVAILVLVIVMIVLSVKAKKRSRSEAEEAVRALANVPPDEEYIPFTAPESVSAQEEAEERAESPSREPVTEPAKTENTETTAGSAEPLQGKEEVTEMAEKKQPPVKKDVKKPEPKKTEPVKKDVKKPEPKKAEPVKNDVKKPEPKKAEPKKAEPAKVSAANGKWVIEAVKGKYWLSLIAPNGQVMLESPTAYASLPSARSGIKTYQDNIAADRLEITEHKNGDSQVQVLTAGGRLLATSSTYSSRAQADSAKESIKRWASTTAVEEVPEK